MRYYNVYFYEDEQINRDLCKLCGHKASYTADEVARCVGLQGYCNEIETFTDLAQAQSFFGKLAGQAETYGHIGTDIIKASYAVIESYIIDDEDYLHDIEIIDIGAAPYTRAS